MSDSFTETTSKSWFSRLKDSLVGILFGLLLFLAAFVVLFWNEGRAVKTHKMLQEGAGVVVSVESGRVDPANEGKLIHVSGKTATSDQLEDPIFDVTVNAIRLKRKVEMLQWKESRNSETTKKLGGGTDTVTTYTYSKDWSETVIDSSGFRKPSGHKNPSTMIMESERWQANTVNLGAFRLTANQIGSIGNDELFPLAKDNKISKKIAGKSRINAGILYLGSKKHDKIGDYRIQMRVVYPGDISVVSGQSGESFQPYKTQVGGAIQMLHTGISSAASMFDAAESANNVTTWILRFVGLIMMFIGLSMIIKIFSVIADIIPFIGNIVGGFSSFVAFLVALVLSLLTVAAAWMFYRPLIGGTLLVVAIGIFYFAQSKAKSGAATPETAEEV